MAETLETFVQKLHADGVKAGQESADKVRAQAEEEARQIIARAEDEARRIVAATETHAEQVRLRTQTELRLAARDAVALLRGSLNRVLRSLLVNAARKQLGDAQVVKSMLHDVARQYVQADIKGHELIEVNVSEATRRELLDWVVHELNKEMEGAGKQMVLQGHLAAEGFEYKASDGTVEVTVDSVVELLSRLLGPDLRRLVQDAVNEGP